MAPEALKRKTILVTGATGFLGRQVVSRLIESGHDVVPIGITAHDVGAEFIPEVPAQARRTLDSASDELLPRERLLAQ